MRIFLKNVTMSCLHTTFVVSSIMGSKIILFGVSGSAKHAAASERHRQTAFDDERQLFGVRLCPGGVVVAFPDDLCFLYLLLQWTRFSPELPAIIIDCSPFRILSARCRKW
ncbi:hypothetical protein ACNKHX_19340 [Shigella flexneri]